MKKSMIGRAVGECDSLGTCPSLRSYQSGPRKDLAMARLLPILAFSPLCLLPDRASADPRKPLKSWASEIGSRHGCACKWLGPPPIIAHGPYGSVATSIG